MGANMVTATAGARARGVHGDVARGRCQVRRSAATSTDGMSCHGQNDEGGLSDPDAHSTDGLSSSVSRSRDTCTREGRVMGGRVRSRGCVRALRVRTRNRSLIWSKRFHMRVIREWW